MHKQVVEWGGTIFHKENFQEIFRGVENFSFPLFSEFWCFPCGFWCQNSYEGGKSAQNSKWGVENHHKDNPSKRGGKNFGNFLGGGKIFFLSMSLWLVHVCTGYVNSSPHFWSRHDVNLREQKCSENWNQMFEILKYEGGAIVRMCY